VVCFKPYNSLFLLKIEVHWFINIKFFAILDILEGVNESFLKYIWYFQIVVVLEVITEELVIYIIYLGHFFIFLLMSIV